ncbi:MAG: AAA family ATPase [Armatimonadota bacterium]
MEIRLRLFIRQDRSGYFSAQPVALPELRSYEETREAAIEALRRDLTAQLQWRDRGSWSDAPFYEDESLIPVRVEVDCRRKGQGEPIPATISVLVSRLPSQDGPRLLLRAPRLPGFQAVTRNEARVEEAAREALCEYLRDRKPAKVLEADLEGEESLDCISLSLGESDQESGSGAGFPGSGDEDDEADSEGGVLALCGVDLTAQAAAGRLSAAARREALLEQLLAILGSDRHNSVLLVGPPDSGKTALVHDVARRLAEGSVPEGLRERALWFVTANNLIAGMKYYGEWQGRAQKLVRQVQQGRQLLYMGDPNEILGAGRFSGSDNNLGRYLRPYMESGEVTLICECSPEAYASELRREPSFIQSFRRIDVPPTDDPDTHAILQAVARRLEGEHPVRVEADALTAVCDLTTRFLPYRAFPGKAVRLLEELVRDLAGPAAADAEPRTLGRDDVVAGFTRATGLPHFLLSDRSPLTLKEVRTYFEERLLGQPDGVEAMVDLVTVLKTGLNDPNKPLGSFFFVGPTGVGKTEMAKVLAEYLFGSRDRMLRFDMSEYASADALPRLIGSAWKPEDEGELTRRVREQPFSVVLLDELEKAHPEVFDALLGVLGEGRLTDAGGRTADFRNAIIIMTSNLAASRREMQAIGFGSEASDGESAERVRAHFIKQAEGFFRPEFFNRIDRIVAFRPLTVEAMRRITRRELGKLLMRQGIVRRNLLVEIDDAVIDRLAEQGFHPLYGARPLQREIERAVILPLARQLMDREVDHRYLLRFTVRDGRIHLGLVPLESGEELETPAREPAPDRRLEADLAEVTRRLERLQAEGTAEDQGPVAVSLRREKSTLLDRTHEPTFWDEPGSARGTLQRVYQLERVLKRLDSLVERGEVLAERARRMRGQRDRRALPELAEAVERLEADFSYLQLELAAAATEDRHDRALLRVAPVGPGAEEWAGRLLMMYRCWAERKGYECAWEAGDEREEHAADALPSARAICVRGPNVYAFLRGEAGLHKLSLGSGDQRGRHLARVIVLPLDDPELPEEPPTPRVEADVEAADSIVRIYSQGRHRYVRDPRTEIRISDVAGVLDEGRLDAFLLARLRQETTP